MSRKTLNSVPGFSTEIGFYLSGMESSLDPASPH
jgi:hypothetical protein